MKLKRIGGTGFSGTLCCVFLITQLSACGLDENDGGSSSVSPFDASQNTVSPGDTSNTVSEPADPPADTVVAQSGSVELSWQAPVVRTDSSPLQPSEIGGYRIYYGSAPGNYPNQLDVADSSAQSATVTDIPLGTHYFVMTAYDTGGRESGYSSMVTRVVQ